MSQYKFKIKYQPKKNRKADILSRKSNIIEKKKNFFYNILQQNSDSIFNLNSNILTTIIIIKSKTKQQFKKIYQKNKTTKNILKKQ